MNDITTSVVAGVCGLFFTCCIVLNICRYMSSSKCSEIKESTSELDLAELDRMATEYWHSKTDCKKSYK